MVQIAWLGKKSPFCGNVSYGLSTTEALRQRGHQTHFIHFDTPLSPERGPASLLGNDPDVSLPYLVKSQVYTIPSLGAQRELRDSLLSGSNPIWSTPVSRCPPLTFVSLSCVSNWGFLWWQPSIPPLMPMLGCATCQPARNSSRTSSMHPSSLVTTG